MTELPTIALSVRQPWAWLIVNGWKDIENRDWKRHYRGPVLIHAGKTLERDAADELDDGVSPCSGMLMPEGFTAPATYDLGGVVGVAEIADCVRTHQSPWFVGDYGFVLRNAKPLPFMPCRGALGFFSVYYTEPQRPEEK